MRVPSFEIGCCWSNLALSFLDLFQKLGSLDERWDLFFVLAQMRLLQLFIDDHLILNRVLLGLKVSVAGGLGLVSD